MKFLCLNRNLLYLCNTSLLSPLKSDMKPSHNHYLSLFRFQDIPAALKTPIDDYMGNPDDYESLFALLYTVYSIPNVIIPLFGS